MSSSIESLMTAVVGQIGEGASAHLYGEKHLFTVKAPPCVIWVRATQTYGPPRSGWDNPRQLWTEVTPIEMHVWGRDETEADTLKNNEIVALSRLANTSYRPTGCAPGSVNKAWLDRGAALVLTVAIDGKVIDQIVPTATVKHVEFESSAHSDGWLESGET